MHNNPCRQFYGSTADAIMQPQIIHAAFEMTQFSMFLLILVQLHNCIYINEYPQFIFFYKAPVVILKSADIIFKTSLRGESICVYSLDPG